MVARRGEESRSIKCGAQLQNVESTESTWNRKNERLGERRGRGRRLKLAALTCLRYCLLALRGMLRRVMDCLSVLYRILCNAFHTIFFLHNARAFAGCASPSSTWDTCFVQISHMKRLVLRPLQLAAHELITSLRPLTSHPT